ncbi:MAG: hypothetical protein FWF90_16495 [Promicromonosporaceae bacterium]|nr:hypothetical protein [Promicromonosporaceae bacterium]
MPRHGKSRGALTTPRRQLVAALTALAVISGGSVAFAQGPDDDLLPTASVTAEDPVEEPTPEPTDEPSAEPTDEPTGDPGGDPAEAPAATPVPEPSAEPTEPPASGPQGYASALAPDAQPNAPPVGIAPAAFAFNPPGTPLPGGTGPDGYYDGFNDAPWFSGGVTDAHWPWNAGHFQGNPNNSDADLGTVHARTTLRDGDVWANVAFDLEAFTGSVAFVVELNQNENRPGAFPVPDRVAGDVVLFISHQGGNTRVELRRWTGSGWSAPSAADARFFEFTANQDTRIVTASVNVSAVFDNAPGLTDFCLGGFGMLNVRTMTSHAFTANLRDWIGGIPITTPQACTAELTVNKTERPASGAERPGAGWEFTASATDPLSVDGAATRTTGDDGRVTYELGVAHMTQRGTVTVTETLREDWRLAEAVCTVNGAPAAGFTLQGATLTVPGVGKDDVVVCDVLNVQYDALAAAGSAAGTYVQPYAWEIDKSVDQPTANARPGAGHEFDWTITVQAEALAQAEFVATSSVTITNPDGGRARSLADVSILLGGRAPTSVQPALTGTLAPGASQTFEVTWALAEHPGTPDVTVTLPGSAAPVTVATASVWTARAEPGRFADLTDEFPEFAAAFPGLGRLDAREHLSARDFTYSATRGQAVTPGQCLPFENLATLTVGGDALEASAVAEVCVGEDLAVSKTAPASMQRTFLWDLAKDVLDPSTLAADANNQATFTYLVTATPRGFSDTDWTLSGTIRVENPNAWAVPLASVVDTPHLGVGVTSAVCTPDAPADGDQHVVPAGGFLEIGYTCSITGQPNLAGTNVVTVTWDPEVAFSATGTASHTEGVQFVFSPTNQTVTVMDDKTDPANPVELGTATWNAEGLPTTFPYEITVDGPVWPANTVDHTNRAWIAELPDIEDDAVVTVTNSPLAVVVEATGSYTIEYNWTLGKVLTSDNSPARARPETGETFGFGITVTAEELEQRDFLATATVTLTNPNPFPVPLTGFTVNVNGTDVPVTADGEIPANGTSTLTFTLHDDDARPGARTIVVTNTAGTQADAAVDFDDVTPDEVNRFADLSDTFPEFGPSVRLDALDLIESAEDGHFTYDALRGDQVGPGQCDEWTNTATLALDDDQLTDQVTVNLCTGLDLGIEKTVVSSFQRTFNWELSKQILGNSTLPAGLDRTATFEYEVTVTPLPYSEALWVMEGEITVSNPNTWDVDVTVVDMPDLGDDVTCSIVGDDEVTIGAGDELTFEYACHFAGAPNLAGNNTARVKWNADAAGSANDSAEHVVDIDEGDWDTTLVNRTITVLDDKTDADGEPVELGTVEWNAAGTPTTFRYSLTLAGPAATGPGTVTHPNTAWIDGLPIEAPFADDAEATVVGYDLALRGWISELHRPGDGMIHSRHHGLDQGNPTGHPSGVTVTGSEGPEDPIMYTTFDDPDADLKIGDTLVKSVVVFNQGDHAARVTGIVNYLVPGLELAPASAWAEVGHTDLGWALNQNGDAVLELSANDAIVLQPGAHYETVVVLVTTDAALTGSGIHDETDGPDDPNQDNQVHVNFDTITEISGFDGWVPDATVQAEQSFLQRAMALLAAPFTASAAGGLTDGVWSTDLGIDEVLDVDSTPSTDNVDHWSFDVDNFVGAQATTGLMSFAAFASQATDQDDHDGETLRLLVPLPLVLGLDVQGAYDVDFQWSIEKSVLSGNDRFTVPGEDVAFEYLVVVDALGEIQELVVSGQVTLENVSDVTVPLDGDVVVTVGGQPATVTLPDGVTEVGPRSSVLADFTVTFDADGTEWTEQLPKDVEARLVGFQLCDDLGSMLENATEEDSVLLAHTFCTADAVLTDATETRNAPSAVVDDSFPEFAAKFTEAERTLTVPTDERSGTWAFTYAAERGAGVPHGDTAEFRNVAWVTPDGRDPVEDEETVTVTSMVFDLALRAWISEIHRVGDGRVFDHHAGADTSGPDYEFPYTAHDDPNTDVQVGDLLVKSIRLFNQGDRTMRVEELVTYAVPGLVVADDGLMDTVPGHDNQGWALGASGNYYLDLEVAPIVLAPGEELTVTLTQQVTSEALAQADDEALLHTFTEISKFSGWVPDAPEVVADPLARFEGAVSPFGFGPTVYAEPFDGVAGSWQQVVDIDSTPGSADHIVRAGETAARWVSNVIHHQPDLVAEHIDEDDHDGEAILVVALRSADPGTPAPTPTTPTRRPGVSAETGGTVLGGSIWGVVALAGAGLTALLGLALLRRRRDEQEPTAGDEIG